MQHLAIVFPHQLYRENPALSQAQKVVIIEEKLFFEQYSFHKQKLVFHRSSMKQYQLFLEKLGLEVEYIDAQNENADVETYLRNQHRLFSTLHFVDPTDDWILQKIKRSAKIACFDFVCHESPNFITTTDQISEYFKLKPKYFQTDFYAYQRKRLNILMDANGKPEGGKLTFDQDNRKPYSANTPSSNIGFPGSNPFVLEAQQYVETHYPNNFGALHFLDQSQYFYPTNFEEAETWLESFIHERLSNFGPYEDAFSKDASIHFLFHSVLTPMLNVGLLTVEQVIEKTLSYHEKTPVPLNSLEGFIRQIIGWREFTRAVYLREGRKQRSTNFWNFQRKIPSSFYNGTTGITPVDNVIKKLLKTGYSHHIERLMILGNFFLLCEFNPDDVYQWFMEMYIDAYDWVMVPNVYGMSQFSDGGIMTTKPYFTGSNYITKMSDYKKGDGEWTLIWDSLFWRFIHVHRGFLQSNPRIGMLVITFDKMSTEKQETYLNTANQFLKALDQNNNFKVA